MPPPSCRFFSVGWFADAQVCYRVSHCLFAAQVDRDMAGFDWPDFSSGYCEVGVEPELGFDFLLQWGVLSSGPTNSIGPAPASARNKPPQ
jgi:hypothetical protein